MNIPLIPFPQHLTHPPTKYTPNQHSRGAKDLTTTSEASQQLNRQQLQLCCNFFYQVFAIATKYCKIATKVLQIATIVAKSIAKCIAKLQQICCKKFANSRWTLSSYICKFATKYCKIATNKKNIKKATVAKLQEIIAKLQRSCLDSKLQLQNCIAKLQIFVAKLQQSCQNSKSQLQKYICKFATKYCKIATKIQMRDSELCSKVQAQSPQLLSRSLYFSAILYNVCYG